MYAVILAGGSGTRFWPWSRREQPKQLLPILSEKPMVRETVDRIASLIPPEQIYVATIADQAKSLFDVIPEVPAKNFLVEPAGKNTAPCIGLAALALRRRDPNSVMVVLPSDHHIGDVKEFHRVLSTAEKHAQEQKGLITLGIRPTRPETGYGYIRVGEVVSDSNGLPVHRVDRFVEKPDLETAKKYVSETKYLWNAGIFVWRSDTILDALRRHVPDIFRGLEQMEAHSEELVPEEIATIYDTFKPISIDYGVMEREEHVDVVPSSFGWNDVGGWQAIQDLTKSDALGNAVTAREYLSIDSKGCIVHAPDQVVATLGLEDVLIVQSGGAILVCKKDRAQEIRKLVDLLKERKLDEYL